MMSFSPDPVGPEGAKGDGPPLGKAGTVGAGWFLSIPPIELGVETKTWCWNGRENGRGAWLTVENALGG